MNKLFTKIVGVCLGLTMAVGVGVAVASNSKSVTPVEAASGDQYTFGAISGTSTDTNWSYTTAKNSGSTTPAWNSGSSELRLYPKNSITFTAKTGYTLTSASFTNKFNKSSNVTISSWNASAGTITTFSNTLTSFSVTGINASSFTITVDGTKGNIGLKTVTMTYSSPATTQKITVNPASGEVYEDETISLTTDAPSANWGLSNNTCSATLSSNSGKTVTVSAGGPGSVRVTATASGYTSPFVDLTFNERPAGTYYSVTDSLTNASLSSTASVEEDAALNLTITAADHYTLPSSITVTMGGNSFSSYNYTRNSGNRTASFSIAAGVIKGNLVISGTAVEDAKYTVTYVHGDHGTGNNYVNNVYGGSYTLVTFATAGFEASSGYSFKKWSVGGVEYDEGASITVSGATTVTAVYKTVEEFTLFSGTLVEGDYIICSGTKAMKNVTTAAPRIDVADVTVTNSKIIDPDASIVWHIAQDGDYWTIYNAAVEKYAAFTSTNGRGNLIDSVTDYARFTTSGSYEFINVAKSDKYLRYNATYGFASYATTTGVTLTLYKAPSNELSSIALSGDYKTSFASGETFSFGGTVTASYTIDTDKTVTGSTTFHLDSSTGTNMSGVTMTHADHDGHTIYAKYTEGGITKTATYSISVANAPVSSLTLASSTGKVATTELFDMSEIGVTILPADAVKTYEWTVLSNTVNNDYTFEANIVEAGNTEGTITLKCTSTADSSKYQTFVLTVSGNPVVTLPNSVTLYTGKTTTVTASVEGGTNPYTYSWSITSGGSYASISSGGSSATVTLSGTAAGSVTLQCSVTDSNSKSDSASVTFSVTASAVTEVNWSASAFDVFSGATIPSNIDDTWEVNYEKNNGDNGYLVFGEYDLYLGSKEITSLPYTFVAEDDGESLHVEYGGISSSSVAVTVTQTINNIVADVTSETTTTFTSKAFADANNGWTSNGKEGNGYTAGQGIQVTTGTTGAGATSKSSFSNVYEIVVTYNTNKKQGEGSIDITVGSNSKVNKSVAYSGSDDGTSANFTETWTYSTKQSGTVTIVVNTTTNSIWLKAITIKTSSGSANIANNASHKDAQRVAVKFANAFNTAMADTANCTTGLSSAWSKCSSAYNTFKSEAAALGSAEEAYAKNLIKYATAQYSDDSGEACIERMMKTYEICVQKHGQTAFMSELVTLQAARVTPLATIVGNSNTIAIIVVISMISITCIGGYFFLRKRKEN